MLTNVLDNTSPFRTEENLVRKGGRLHTKGGGTGHKELEVQVSLKMKTINSSKILVKTYHTMQCHKLEAHKTNIYDHRIIIK
jgi:hypothetical protein